jgi:hypothetical protein
MLATAPALHSLRFHDILHTLESYGYRLTRDDTGGNPGYVLSEQNPLNIVDTLRLTQRFAVERLGVFWNLEFPNGQTIGVDLDYYGTRIFEIN